MTNKIETIEVPIDQINNNNELVSNKIVLKAIPIDGDKDPRGISRKIPEDLFKQDYKSGVIEPPFDLFTLATMTESSSILGPCIDAMAINIEKQGHRIVPRDSIKREDETIRSEIQNELAIVENFFDNATLDYTFKVFRERLRRDYEGTGNSYYEVLTSLLNPEIPAGLEHLPSWTMRLYKMDEQPTEYEVSRAIRVADNRWEVKKFPHRKYFRRYVQRKEAGTSKVFFKEWGDPRVIDYRTGEVLSDSWDSANQNQREVAATQIIHRKLYSPRSPYGLPRFIGNLFKIYGNRAAETINYTTLKCNNIPALMLLATNAQLSKGSINRIKEFVEERIQGDNNYSTILIIEAEPITEGMKDPGMMKLELKPLTDTQHTDAMFLNYTDKNDESIRQSYRMPPIFLGRADEYNRSTSDSSRKLAEEQIFKPERDDVDDDFNTTLVPALGAASVLYRSNTPNVTDNYELTQLLAVAERSGGLSPHISRIVVEDVLGKELPEVDPSINPQLPFTLTMLREQLMYETNTSGEVTKSWSEDEIISQLRMLKGLAKQADGISEDVIKSLDNLIGLMEIGNNEEIKKLNKPISKLEESVNKIIREDDGRYCVYSEDGSHNFGCYDTKEEAEERLAQIHIFSEEDKTETSIIKFQPVLKSENSEEMIIGGAVLVPGVIDLQGDTYDETAVEYAAYFWFENYLEDPKENGIKLMHKDEVIYNALRPIQSWVLDRNTTFQVDVSAAVDDHPSKDLTEITYPKGTWMLFARFREPELWEAHKRGEYLGWSIGGVALVQQLKQYMKRTLGNNRSSQ